MAIPGQRHKTIKVGRHHWRVTNGVLIRDDRDNLVLADVTKAHYRISRGSIDFTVTTAEQRFRIAGRQRSNFQTLCALVLRTIGQQAPNTQVRIVGGALRNVLGVQVDPTVAAAAIMHDARRPHRYLR